VSDLIPLTCNKVTKFLVSALAQQVILEYDNVLHAIEEMTVLCCKLLSSNALEDDLSPAVEILARIVETFGKDTYHLPWQQLHECLREANIWLPELQHVSMALSITFYHRFDITRLIDDYQYAMGHMDKYIAYHSHVGSHKLLRRYLSDAATIARRRFLYYSNPEHLEEAICCTRAHLGIVSVEDPEHDEITQTLTRLVRRHAKEFGNTGIPEGYPNSPVVGDYGPSQFWNSAAVLAEWNTEGPLSMTAEELGQHVDSVMSAGRTTDKAEIHKAVQYC